MPANQLALYRDLMETARAQLEHSYAPYSHFRVGSALLCPDGTKIAGSNIECTTISLNICAERSALAAAASQGRRQFTAVAVVAAKAANCWPCGPCRQSLFEFAPDLDVIVEDGSKNLVVVKLSELLPQAAL